MVVVDEDDDEVVDVDVRLEGRPVVLPDPVAVVLEPLVVSEIGDSAG